MKKDVKKVVAIVICIVSLAGIIIPQNVLAGTKINANKKTLYAGENYQLKITGTSNKIKWKSSNTKIATVSSSGKVNAIKKGTVKIIASIGNNKYICNIKVINDNREFEEIERYLIDKNLMNGERLDLQPILSMIGAKKGVQYTDTAGKTIEIYEYSINNKIYKEISKTLKTTLFDQTVKFNAVNGKFVLYCDVDNSKDVIKAFKQF